MYIDTKRSSFHLSCSQEEQRAAAFLALTGEEFPHPLSSHRKTTEKPFDRSLPKLQKSQTKYRPEDLSDDGVEQEQEDRCIEDWVDGISQSTIRQDFETAPRSPTTEMMINAAIRFNLDTQKAANQVRNAQKSKLERKPLVKHTMSSKHYGSCKLKPLSDYTMNSSSQKAQAPESVCGLSSSVNHELPQVAVRGDVQHQHYHHHHFHGTSPEIPRNTGEVWITRDHSGQLRYERKANPRRSRSQKHNDLGSDNAAVAKGFSGCQIM